MGAARLFRNGYGADETKEAFEHALFLADNMGETPLRVPVPYCLWVNKYVRAEYADALVLAESLLEFVESGTDSASIMLATRIVGISLSMGEHFVDERNTAREPRFLLVTVPSWRNLLDKQL